MSKNNQLGFTLVEIAIVLVIVGLLIGAVLKGREMITNANIKRIESDRTELSAAVHAYQDRYKILPGDDNEASTRFTIYSGVDTVNGDGDGQIGTGDDWDTVADYPWAADDSHEPSKAFGHLRAAGLVTGAPNSPARPRHALGGPIGIQDGALNIGEHAVVFGVVEGSTTQILETRNDDGLPHTGRLQADLDTQLMTSGKTSSVTSYDDNNRYNLAFTL